MAKRTKLSNPHICIVLAYAPAGLGHLRVTNALRFGLPDNARPLLLPESNTSIRWIHRLTSRNPLGKRLMEWAQYGKPERVVTKVFRKILRRDAGDIEEKLVEIYKQQVDVPQALVVVASHFGIAHQVAVVKDRLEKRIQAKVLLVMQVTDDSPQKIWYVPNADLITVPSEMTKETLLAYGKTQRLGKSKFVVLPYPISPILSEELLPAALRHRTAQLNPASDSVINVSIPVSGAAVGTLFASSLMKELHKRSKRFDFHVVCKRTLYTEFFLQSIKGKSWITVYQSHSDRQVVQLYDQAFETAVMSLEMTKPSEQAFKALLTPQQTGGVILLFTTPVGRQEYDNLDFLRRHALIPNTDEQNELWQWAHAQWKMTTTQRNRVFEQATHWRGLRIPEDAAKAAVFIQWCHEHGVFAQMRAAVSCSRGDILCREEVAPDGVKKFWEEVEKLL